MSGVKAEEEYENFKREVARVLPDMKLPPTPGDKQAVAALDSIAIFAQTYYEFQDKAPEPLQVSIAYEPNAVMEKHSAMYGMKWVASDKLKDVWYLAKK